jgi:hypothetical protein
MAWSTHPVPRVVPSAQELYSLPSSVIAQEIVNIEAVIANRYTPNDTFAELCDTLRIEGKEEIRVFFADILRYRAALYTAQQVQATEQKHGGIGILNVKFHDRGEWGGGRGGWGY